MKPRYIQLDKPSKPASFMSQEDFKVITKKAETNVFFVKASNSKKVAKHQKTSSFE